MNLLDWRRICFGTICVLWVSAGTIYIVSNKYFLSRCCYCFWVFLSLWFLGWFAISGIVFAVGAWCRKMGFCVCYDCYLFFLVCLWINRRPYIVFWPAYIFGFELPVVIIFWVISIITMNIYIFHI